MVELDDMIVTDSFIEMEYYLKRGYEILTINRVGNHGYSMVMLSLKEGNEDEL